MHYARHCLYDFIHTSLAAAEISRICFVTCDARHRTSRDSTTRVIASSSISRIYENILSKLKYQHQFVLFHLENSMIQYEEKLKQGAL
jgi:hypothetical protein